MEQEPEDDYLTTEVGEFLDSLMIHSADDVDAMYVPEGRNRFSNAFVLHILYIEINIWT